MITYSTGDLLKSYVQAYVNPVNCVGVMGKGLALQFRNEFPENFFLYRQRCKALEMQVGYMFTVAVGGMGYPDYIINFPTKSHWRDPSHIEYIEQGLEDLVKIIPALNIQSIAIPALGCGNGGLAWSDVEPLITKAFQLLPHVDVRLYPPEAHHGHS